MQLLTYLEISLQGCLLNNNFKVSQFSLCLTNDQTLSSNNRNECNTFFQKIRLSLKVGMEYKNTTMKMQCGITFIFVW